MKTSIRDNEAVWHKNVGSMTGRECEKGGFGRPLD
jgi:hypothetical protein